MAITTLDGAIAGMQPQAPIMKVGAAMKGAGIPHTFWYTAGVPGAAAANAVGVNGAAVTGNAVVGQVARNDPTSGLNAYLARLSVTASVSGTLLLIDRLWHNSGLSTTLTTSQSITPATLPSRDANGLTDGDGVLAALEWSAAGGAGTPTVTLTYTDHDGNTGQSATLVANTTPNAGTFEIFQLAAGDHGVRAPTALIQTATRTSGTYHLVLFRILAQVEVTAANVGNAIDVLTGGMPRLYNGTVPQLVWIPTATTATTIMGQYIETQG